MWTKSKSILLTRIAVVLFMAALVAGALLLPLLLKWYISSRGTPKEDYWPMLIMGWLFVPPAFTALLCMHKLLKNIRHNQLFVRDNVKLFRVLSWCCFAAAFPFLFYGLVNIISFFFAAVVAFVALLLRVAKNMLETAMEIKDENDLTV